MLATILGTVFVTLIVAMFLAMSWFAALTLQPGRHGQRPAARVRATRPHPLGLRRHGADV